MKEVIRSFCVEVFGEKDSFEKKKAEPSCNSNVCAEYRYDGYKSKIFDDSFSQLKTGATRPKPEFSNFDFQNGDLAVVVDGSGGNVLVEYSDDFSEWSPLITIPNTDGVIQFNDPTSLESLMRFYRLKSFVRPASPPKWTLEFGVGGDRGNGGAMPPNIVGPIIGP